MKKIFTLMLTFACAMFVGVSCTTDGPADNGGTPPPAEPTYDVVITVGELAEPFAANGGTATLSVTLSKDVIGANVVAETSATWLSASVNEDNELVLVASPFQAVTAPRTAEVVVSYVDSNNNNLAAPVPVDASQVSQTPQFSVAWTNQTPVGATATISVLDTDKQDMVWGAYAFGASRLAVSDDEGGIMPWNTRADVTMKTPEQYAAEQLELMASPMGYGGLYLGFCMMASQDPNYLLSDVNGNTMNCSLYSEYGPGESKMYIAVVGIDKQGVDMDAWTDSSTMSTVIHIFEVQNLPKPVVSVDKSEVELTSAAGCLPVGVTLENAYGENSVWSATSNVDWIEVGIIGNNVHLNYKENPYAVDRKAVVTVSYTYKCMIQAFWGAYEAEVPVSTTINVVQKKNSSVTPVTFKLEVVETHFDHVLVNVTPSDLNASYYMDVITADDFAMSYIGNSDWYTLSTYQTKYGVDTNKVYTGALSNHRIDVDTEYLDDWTHYVYAFTVDAETSTVTGEVAHTDPFVVKNDAPRVEFNMDYEVATDLFVTYNDNAGKYELQVPAEGGTFTVKYSILDAPEGAVVRLTNGDSVYDWNNVLENDVPVFDDENQTITFTVNPFGDKESYENYVQISVRAYTDANKTKSLGKSVTFQVNQTLPQAE